MSGSTLPSTHKHHANPQTLTIPFQVPHRGPATVHATINPLTNADQHGITLLNLYTNPSTVTSHSSLGYATLYGWIQMTHSPGEDWVMDLYPPFQALNSPFFIWGADPTVVDCPGREGVREYDWSARTFLCYSPDAAMTRRVVPILGFEWGFWIEGGDAGG